MAKAVAGSGAAALDTLGLQGRVWRKRRRRRRLEEDNGNKTHASFERGKVQARRQQQQRRRHLLVGRDDSWGISAATTGSSQFFTRTGGSSSSSGTGISDSGSNSWSSRSGSNTRNQKNKKGRPPFRRNIGGGVHGGTEVEEGWALEEHDRGGRGSHRPVPMVLGDDDDAGGAHSMHSGDGGLRGHVER